MTIEQLRSSVEQNGPALVGTRIPGTGSHTMTVDKVDNGQVYLRDTLPENGRGSSYSIKVKDFEDVWKKTAVTLPQSSGQ